MALPKLNQPVFELTLPSTGNTIRYRPFTVKEEKLLLMAQESGERKDIINTYKQLINNCCVDPVDVDNMASFDLEYFFICLRAKSVSNIAKVIVKDGDDGNTYDVEINLDKVEIKRKQNVSNNILLSEEDKIGIVLKYPTFSMMSKIKNDQSQLDTTMQILRGCISQIYQGEEVHNATDSSDKELDEFILSLSKSHVEAIQKYFEAMPKIVYEAKYVKKDGTVKDITIEGLENFF